MVTGDTPTAYLCGTNMGEVTGEQRWAIHTARFLTGLPDHKGADTNRACLIPCTQPYPARPGPAQPSPFLQHMDIH